MLPSFREIYEASWLWLPFLVMFLVQGLHCSPKAKGALLRIALYYIVAAIGLHLLLPITHLALRNLLFDLATRLFLFIQAAEQLWICWSTRPALSPAGVFGSQKLVARKNEDDDDDDEGPQAAPHAALPAALIFSAICTLVYLGWLVLGLMFAFILTPGL